MHTAVLVHFPNYQQNISEGTYDLRLVVVTKRLLDGEFVLESEYLNGLKYKNIKILKKNVLLLQTPIPYNSGCSLVVQ